MHKRVQRILIALACLTLIGCVTPLDPPAGEKSITEGVTTYEQVVKAFGRPDAEMRGADGKRLVSYFQTRSRRSFDAVMFGRLASNQGEVEFRHLDILFSPQKSVERYHYSAASEQVRSRVSHFEMGNAVNEEKLLQLKKGSTTRAEVVEAFGPPLAERIKHQWATRP